MFKFIEMEEVALFLRCFGRSALFLNKKSDVEDGGKYEQHSNNGSN